MTTLLLTIFYLLFFALAWRRLPLAVLFIVAALPSYLIRFRLGPIPMTLLEGMILVVIAVWAIQKLRAWQNESRITNKESWVGLILKSLIHNSLFIIPLTLFLFAATVSVFIAPDLRAAAGVWKAYFIEPVLFFVVLFDLMHNPLHLPLTLRGRDQGIPPLKIRGGRGSYEKLTPQQIIAALSFTAILLSAYAIFQRFTGFGIPPPWDVELRVTSVFPYPNALGLFLGPLIPLFLMQFFYTHQSRANSYDRRNLRATCYWLVVLLLSIVAIIFAKSTGALVGIVAGLFTMAGLYIVQAFCAWHNELRIRNSESGKRKTIIHYSLFIIPFTILVVLSISAWFSSPRLREELTLRDWSGHVRRTQWSETWEMLKDTSTSLGAGRPILGAGLAGYKAALTPYHKATYLEIFEYPHNIVLNFWTETGLLGLVSFACLIVLFFIQARHKILNPKSEILNKFKIPNPKHLEFRVSSFEFAAVGAMTALLVHGLVDVPYFKNDLAMLFWIIFALGLTPLQIRHKEKKLAIK